MGATDYGAYLMRKAQDHDGCEPALTHPAAPALHHPPSSRPGQGRAKESGRGRYPRALPRVLGREAAALKMGCGNA